MAARQCAAPFPWAGTRPPWRGPATCWVRELVPGAWSPEDVSRPLAAGGTARGCRGRVRTFLSSLIDLLTEGFYLTGEDGKEFPVVVEFNRHVDGFGLQFEPAGGSPEGAVAALRVH